MKIKKEYVMYKGDNVVAYGTIKEIAQKLNIKIETVYCIMSPSRKKRTRNYDSQYFFVDVTDIEEDINDI